MRLALALTAACAALADTRSDQVDQVFAPWNRPDSPGCAAGAFSKGEALYKKGFGMADLEHGVPITPQSLFYLASVSKQLTAAAIAMLDADRKLSLDDPLRKWIPELPASVVGNVKVRHLVHHTSGIRDYLSLQGLAGKPDNYYTSDDEVIRLLARQKALNFAPGAEYLYSNSGYVLLSVIVKRASGKSLREFSRERIFAPLGMSNSLWGDDHNEIIRNRAAGYSPRASGGWRTNSATLDVYGDGAAFSSLDELALWDQNFYANRLQPPDLIARITTPGVKSNGEKIAYAFGLGAGEYRGLKTIGHSGGFRGYSADRLQFPEQGFSVLVLCNASSANAPALARKIAGIYLADQLRPAAAEAAKPELAKTLVAAPPLERYLGEFYSEELDATFRLVVQDKALTALRAAGGDIPLEPVQRDVFRARGATVRFERDAADNVAAFRVSEGRARGLIFTRVR